MTRSSSSSHVLGAAPPQRLFHPHIIFVSQFSLHYMGDNFHVGMPVGVEAAIGLDEIIIHHV